MKELYIYSGDDKLVTVLSEETGLLTTLFKDYQNHISDETFTFEVIQSKQYSQSYDTEMNLTQVAGNFIGTFEEVVSTENVSPIEFIEEENQVAFFDRDGDLRLMRIKELDEITTDGESIIKVTCEPSYLELHDHFIEDRRITDGTAQTALNRALDGSRYVGEVTVDLGLATDNFYWIDGIEAVFKILETWGGALKDTITLDDNNEIIERKLWIVQRLGTDNGLIVEPDYNAETISRNTLSYPETALWGQGASLQIEDDEGELTGGHTRYITFEDVEWKVSKGDPVDKPKGQKWVGDPDALARDGYLDNGTRKHRFGHFSNQDYEDPEELLWATWQELQERKLKEIMHEATIYESDKKVSLGDTVTILNREYNKPIELQSQITGLEYDVLYPDDEIKIVVGKYVDMNKDPLEDDVEDLKNKVNRPQKPIDKNSFPNKKPSTPINIRVESGIEVIQIYWDYADEIFIKHYEVYGSQIKDFVPDEQHLLWRGQVSAFGHMVNTEEKWYYRIRAVSYRDKVSDWSTQAVGNTRRITTPDIMFGEEMAEKLRDLNEISDIIGNNGIDFDNLSDGISDYINGKVDADKIVSEINVKKEGVRIAGDLIHLDGLTLIDESIIQSTHIADAAIESAHLGQAIIDDAHIDELTGNVFVVKSINADRLNVANLSSVSANLGKVTAGILESKNNNMYLNLNTGELTMKNADFTLDNGANIRFGDRGNKLYFQQTGNDSIIRSSGLIVGKGETGRPIVSVGSASPGVINTDYSWSGLTVSSQASQSDGSFSSITSRRFLIRDRVDYNRAINFEMLGSRPSLKPTNGGTYNYDLGSSSNKWNRFYVRQLHTVNTFNIYNDYNNKKGYRFETEYSGDGSAMAFRGRNQGSYNYNLGASGNAWNRLYVKYEPNVASDERLKEEIEELDLGLSFIRDVSVKKFRRKTTEADRNQGIFKNKVQFGVLAQQLLKTLKTYNLGINDMTVVEGSDESEYSVQYGQLIMPTIKAVQDIDKKLTDEVIRIKGKAKDNSTEIQMLKERIKQLEESA